MPDISSVGHGSVGPIDRPGALTERQNLSPVRKDRPEKQEAADRVELSNVARYLSRLRRLPEVRQNLVDRVRDQIENDRYITNDKVDVTTDRILEEFETNANG